MVPLEATSELFEHCNSMGLEESTVEAIFISFIEI
jgi:hypothetical protein